ncbi:hypothetical protein ES705_50628 [subsurface metagenome]
MARKLTPGQVAKELNNIVLTFSGKSISGWIQEAWEKSQKTTIGQAAAGVERAARAVDPYAVLGLPHSASLEEVKRRYSPSLTPALSQMRWNMMVRAGGVCCFGW